MESEEVLKTEYYTLATIDEKSRQVADQLSLFRGKHKNQVILPKNIALLRIFPMILLLTDDIKYLCKKNNSIFLQF